MQRPYLAVRGRGVELARDWPSTSYQVQQGHAPPHRQERIDTMLALTAYLNGAQDAPWVWDYPTCLHCG